MDEFGALYLVSLGSNVLCDVGTPPHVHFTDRPNRPAPEDGPGAGRHRRALGGRAGLRLCRRLPLPQGGHPGSLLERAVHQGSKPAGRGNGCRR